MFSLAHISDIHLAPLPHVRKRDLISKRVTGYVNWRANRKKTLGNTALAALRADLLAHRPDHIAITGDLVNLALDAEFDATHLWLEQLGSDDYISVIPGNHDAYVPGALLTAHRAWGKYMPINAIAPQSDDDVDDGFPYMRRVGPVALIGVSSAVASIPFLSTGRFRDDQAVRLSALLKEAEKDGLFRVVLIHHPPFRYDGDVAKRLYGVRLFQKTVKDAGAELVLHGHTHIRSFEKIGTGNLAIPVIGVPSASQSPGGQRPAACWNEFQIAGAPARWNCHWIERGIALDGTVSETGSRQLLTDGGFVSAA
ncbi:MAG: metallophosphoesterase family protein [Rhizobiaceae bacterium]